MREKKVNATTSWVGSEASALISSPVGRSVEVRLHSCARPRNSPPHDGGGDGREDSEAGLPKVAFASPPLLGTAGHGWHVLSGAKYAVSFVLEKRSDSSGAGDGGWWTSFASSATSALHYLRSAVSAPFAALSSKTRQIAPRARATQTRVKAVYALKDIDILYGAISAARAGKRSAVATPRSSAAKALRRDVREAMASQQHDSGSDSTRHLLVMHVSLVPVCDDLAVQCVLQTGGEEQGAAAGGVLKGFRMVNHRF